MTIANFVVHPDDGGRQETDVDVLGVRFPFRAENLRRPMKDDEWGMRYHDKPLIAITEVKTGRCGLNGPWRDPERRNMLRVLRAIGAFAKPESEAVAHALYETGSYTGELHHVSLVCIGREHNPEVAKTYPRVPQILWPEILRFIYYRFDEYRNQKASHQQWDDTGHNLWSQFARSRGGEEFVSAVSVTA